MISLEELLRSIVVVLDDQQNAPDVKKKHCFYLSAWLNSPPPSNPLPPLQQSFLKHQVNKKQKTNIKKRKEKNFLGYSLSFFIFPFIKFPYTCFCLINVSLHVNITLTF